MAVFQPAEETGDGAQAMVDDRLVGLLPKVDVDLAQHVLPAPAGLVGTHAGPTLSAADSMRITLRGRGVTAPCPRPRSIRSSWRRWIVVRFQTVVARETRPGEPVVVTVGSLQAGTTSNVIPDHAVIELIDRSPLTDNDARTTEKVAEWPRVKAAYERWLSPSNFAGGGSQRVALSAVTGRYVTEPEGTLACAPHPPAADPGVGTLPWRDR